MGAMWRAKVIGARGLCAPAWDWVVACAAGDAVPVFWDSPECGEAKVAKGQMPNTYRNRRHKLPISHRRWFSLPPACEMSFISLVVCPQAGPILSAPVSNSGSGGPVCETVIYRYFCWRCNEDVGAPAYARATL